MDIVCKFNRMLFLSLPGRHLCCKGNAFGYPKLPMSFGRAVIPIRSFRCFLQGAPIAIGGLSVSSAILESGTWVWFVAGIRERSTVVPAYAPHTDQSTLAERIGCRTIDAVVEMVAQTTGVGGPGREKNRELLRVETDAAADLTFAI